MARGERRRAAKRAVKEEAEETLAFAVLTRVGQVLWYGLTAPFRLAARTLDAWLT